MLLKKYSHIFFVFYGSLLIASQESNAMIPQPLTSVVSQGIKTLKTPCYNRHNFKAFEKASYASSPAFMQQHLHLPQTKAELLSVFNNIVNFTKKITTHEQSLSEPHWDPYPLFNNQHSLPSFLINEVQSFVNNTVWHEQIPKENIQGVIVVLLLASNIYGLNSQPILPPAMPNEIIPVTQSFDKKKPTPGLATLKVTLNFANIRIIKPMNYSCDLVSKIMEKNALLATQKNDAEKKIKTLSDLNNKQEAIIKNLEDKKEKLACDNKQKEEKINELQKNLDDVNQETEKQLESIKTLEDSLKEYKTKLAETGTKLQQQEKENTYNKEQINQHKEKIEQLNLQITTLETKYKKEYDELNKSFTTVQSLVKDDVKEEFNKINAESASFEKFWHEAEQTIEKLKKSNQEEINNLKTDHDKKLKENTANASRLEEEKSELRYYNNTLTAGCLILCLLLYLENLYYKNKIEKLTLLCTS